MDKVFQLTINRIEKDPPIVSSNYRAKRSVQKVEYYATKESADARSREIYEGLKNILGSFDGIEVEIRQFEVRP